MFIVGAPKYFMDKLKSRIQGELIGKFKSKSGDKTKVKAVTNKTHGRSNCIKIDLGIPWRSSG